MRIKLILIIVFCAWGALRAQPAPFSLLHYTTEDGLSHDDVACILKDRSGFLWFGTLSGLNRFDGQHFRVFHHVPGDTTSLPDDRIYDLEQDEPDRLWVGTNLGLCRLDLRTMRFERVPLAGYPEGPVTAIDVAPDGRLWVGGNDVLLVVDVATGQSTSFPLQLVRASVVDLLVDRRGRIWFSDELNLWRFNPADGSQRLYAGRNSESPALAFDAGSPREDEQGRIWASTWGNGLIYYDEATDAFVDFPDKSTISTCYLADTDVNGRPFFWIGGGNNGLYTFTPDDGHIHDFPYEPRDPYSHNGRMSNAILYDDETGIVWIATEDGIEKYDPFAIRFRRAFLPAKEGFRQFRFVSGAVQDRTSPGGNHCWVTVWGGGLYRWDRAVDTIGRSPLGAGLTHIEVFTAIQGRDGRLYFGNFGGVDILDPVQGKWSYLKGFMTTPRVNHKILSLTEDHDGRIWIGANFEGLFCYYPSSGRLESPGLTDEQGQPFRPVMIWAIAEDKNGNLWLAADQGLVRVDVLSGQCRLAAAGLPANYGARDVCISRNGRIWAATPHGLIEVDSAGNLLRRFTQRDHLRTNDVTRIAEDSLGRLWIGTANGLHCLDLAAGKMNIYDKSDGLFNNSISDGFVMMPSGELLVGFQNSFNFFRPEQVAVNQRPPPVWLTSLRVMNEERPYDYDQPLVLRPRENVVTFEFGALNFSQAEKNRYAYRLEGFDRDWIVTDKPVATYTNLDGGNYTLRVRAANNDGVWNNEGFSLPLHVVPPFTRRWYFPFLLMALTLALIGAVSHYRRIERSRLEAVRRSIARDLHDDMGSTLSSIRFFSEYARAQVEKDNPEVVPVLERINRSSAELSEAMQDIIWAISNDSNRLEDLITRMREFGLRVLEARGITFTVKGVDGFHPGRLHLSQRRNIYLIFKEAVNNAAKYSSCREVTLFLTIVRHHLKMTIDDDGQGFEVEKVSAGNGLRNMTKRAEEIGGELKINSTVGKGTTVELQVRLAR